MESKTRVDGADLAAGSPDLSLHHPFPHIQHPKPGLGPLRLLRDVATGQASALQPRAEKTAHLGPGNPLGSRVGADASLGQRDRVTKAVVLQGGDPQAPGHQAWAAGRSLCWAHPTPGFQSQFVGSFSKFRDALSPALASAQPEREVPGLQASLSYHGLCGPHLSRAQSCLQSRLPLVGP